MLKNLFKKLFASLPAEETTSEPVKVKTAKELATEKGEPWVTVLDTKVNIENPRNGFFELDWNESFIAMLKANGFNGENDEEIYGKNLLSIGSWRIESGCHLEDCLTEINIC